MQARRERLEMNLKHSLCYSRTMLGLGRDEEKWVLMADKRRFGLTAFYHIVFSL